MIVISGSASEELARRVSDELKCSLIKVECKKFPDGELYVRILGDVKDENILIIQSTYKSPNDNYMELFLLVDAVRDLGAKKVTVIIPYFAYARQDDRFKSGEAVSLNTVSKLIESVGADEIYTIDLHAHRINNSIDVFDIPSKNLSAAPLLAKYVMENFRFEDPVIMGPDGEARQWAEEAGNAINADWDFMVKKRFGPRDVEITPRRLDVNDRDVLIIDDIISTGGTMLEAIKIMRENNANNIYVACTHPVFSGNALKKMRSSGVKKIISTDTIPSEVSLISVSPVITKAISQ